VFAMPAPGTFGTSKRNQFYGPGFTSTDFSVIKNTPITERLRTQLRIEIFNLFNTQNLSWPENCLCSDTLGKIFGSRNAEIPGIGAGEAINVQVALKFIW
jgi:hypothetical protein